MDPSPGVLLFSRWQSFYLPQQEIFSGVAMPFVMLMVFGTLWTLLWLWVSRTGCGRPRDCQLTRKQEVQWDSRVVSLVHAVVSIVGGVYVHFIDNEGASEDGFLATFAASPLRDFCLMITCGYLMYDLLLCCVVYRKELEEDKLLLLHHVLIIVAFMLGVATHIGTFYMASFLVNELSTIFFNINFFVATILAVAPSSSMTASSASQPSARSAAAFASSAGGDQRRHVQRQRQHTQLQSCYKLNGVLLLVSFFVARIVHNAFSFYHMLSYSWIPLHALIPRMDTFTSGMCIFLSLLCAGHILINLVWFVALVRAVMRKLGRKTEKAVQVPGVGKGDAEEKDELLYEEVEEVEGDGQDALAQPLRGRRAAPATAAARALPGASPLPRPAAAASAMKDGARAGGEEDDQAPGVVSGRAILRVAKRPSSLSPTPPPAGAGASADRRNGVAAEAGDEEDEDEEEEEGDDGDAGAASGGEAEEEHERDKKTTVRHRRRRPASGRTGGSGGGSRKGSSHKREKGKPSSSASSSSGKSKTPQRVSSRKK